MVLKKKYLFLLFSILVYSGCSTFQPARKVSVELKQPSVVTESGLQGLSKKKGDLVELHEAPLFIESPGHVGVVLVPTELKQGKIQVSLRSIEGWGGEQLDSAMNRNLSEILYEVSSIQNLLVKQKSREALLRAQGLQSKYPRVPAIQFLTASCLIATGQSEQAKRLLSGAMKESEDDPNAKKLFELFNFNKKEGSTQ
jgi:predicted Zn-dependent protease